MKRWMVCGALAVGLFTVAAAQAQKKESKPAEKAPAEQPAPEAAAEPKISPEKQKLIRQVQDLDGSGERAKVLVEDMKNSMRSQMTELPQDFWDILDQEMNVVELVEMQAQLYDLQYTTEDLQGLIKFYQTPLGKKVSTAQPAIERESFAVAQDWGRGLLNRTGARFQAKFGQPKPGEPAAPGAPAPPGAPQ